MKSPAAVFFDFDGVLCTDKFFAALKPEYPEVQEWITRHVFRGERYGDTWMRGHIDSRQMNRIIACGTGIDCELLDRILPEGIHGMQVNQDLIRWAETFKQRGIKVTLVTNNMDVFNEITVPVKQLDKTFPVIVNSCDHGLMKQDENGKLFDIALQKTGLDRFEDVLLIDDSVTYCDIFKAKGGQAYQYTGQNDFNQWVSESKILPLE